MVWRDLKSGSIYYRLSPCNKFNCRSWSTGMVSDSIGYAHCPHLVMVVCISNIGDMFNSVHMRCADAHSDHSRT